MDAIEPLLPPEPPKPKGGRPRVPDRAGLTGPRAEYELLDAPVWRRRDEGGRSHTP